MGEQLPEITEEGVLASAHEAAQDAEEQPVSLQVPFSSLKPGSPVLMYFSRLCSHQHTVQGVCLPDNITCLSPPAEPAKGDTQPLRLQV